MHKQLTQRAEDLVTLRKQLQGKEAVIVAQATDCQSLRELLRLEREAYVCERRERVRVCVRVRVGESACACACACAFAFVFVCMHVYIFVYTCMCVCSYIYAHTSTYTGTDRGGVLTRFGGRGDSSDKHARRGTAGGGCAAAVLGGGAGKRAC
jgi:hypothetical protein